MRDNDKFRSAVVEAMESLGGCGTVAEISSYIHDNYKDQWEDMGEKISQLCVDNESSTYPPDKRILHQVSSGRFCLTKWHDQK